MDTPLDINTQVSALLENNLRKKIITPLLIGYGVDSYSDSHGPREDGKDVYFSYRDLFGNAKHCCIFLKAGDLTKSGNNDVRKMIEAIREALFVPFPEPISRSEVNMQEIFVICNGEINSAASDYLVKNFKTSSFPNFQIINIHGLSKLIKNLITKYGPKIDSEYIFHTDSFMSYCQRIADYKAYEFNKHSDSLIRGLGDE